MKPKHPKPNGRVTTLPPELVEILRQVYTVCYKPRRLCDESFLAEFDWAVDLANIVRHEEAMAFIDELLSKYPNMPKTFRAHLYYLKAFTLHNNTEDYPKAMQYYDRAISFSPEPEGVYYYDRGLLKQKLGDEKGKESDFRIARKKSYDWGEDDGDE